MSIADYLRDRLSAYMIYLATLVTALIFMSAFHISRECIIIVYVILLLGGAVSELWVFFRKKSFYDKLTYCLENLDKKYLLAEMIEAPDFFDGKILYDVLCQSDKAMCEHIAEYRRENLEFREYIEMWVHEVKLPVASLQLMCHNDGSTRYSEQLKRIDDYIENVLYYARSRNAEKDYIIKNASLKRIFGETAMKNRTEIQERNISLSAEGLDVEVMTDAKWLAFIFGQLMGNSIKYDANEIKVYAEDFNDRTVLHFRDNGIGILESDLPYIFEKSFTGENGRTHTKSTGMGLYIVKMLCTKLGHSVQADSVQGEYTDISIVFGKNDLHNMHQ
ncbi:MAG: sensor histidine kinase [Ruminococcus sp.]|uniref:sensor histidine kinase n=1 Tax=Ruminococcus sp. TaxID=41978 RepID=UPI0025E55396|nr:sensor histidine kinase [Ruminococcus sp.]MCR5542067.1 sensor histidine kinase [Ruminococcus sp.]